MAEEWRPVAGWEGWYEVSSLGTVRRVASGKSTRRGRVLKVSVNNDGYCGVRLHRPGMFKSFGVHRLVATAFLDNPLGLETVNHKNGVKADNSVANLEWMSKGDNIRHAHATGLARNPRGEKHNAAKINNMIARVIRKCALLGMKHREIAEVFGCHESTVSNIHRGKQWSHV